MGNEPINTLDAGQRRARLSARWATFWSAFGAGDGDPHFDALFAAWNEASRAYHTPEHLSECLALLDTVIEQAERPKLIEAALWFHDAIYDARRSDNEARSAEWADRVMRLAGLDRAALDALHALIMVTAHAGLPQTPDQALLVDIDLSILGAPRERFDRYDRDVRREYAHVPMLAYRLGRRRVLKTFLKRENIYTTAAFHERLEASARANLKRAIRKLSLLPA